MPHFHALRAAFNSFHDYLSDDGDQLQAARLAAIYREHFHGDAFPTTRHKSKPQYSDETYPSLFESLTVLPDGKAVSLGGLPQLSESWADLNDQIKNSALSRVLLGVIWKQGDLNALRHVFSGIRDEASIADDRVVMYQFGRHLADPLKQPIFDQHTYRAYRLLVELDSWADRQGYAQLFRGKGAIPKKDRLPAGALAQYLTWWNATVSVRLHAALEEKLSAISAIDRLLFSLGKAAKLQINA